MEVFETPNNRRTSGVLRELHKLKLLCLLGVLTRKTSLRNLSVKLGVDASILSKYMNKQVTPRYPRLKSILDKLGEIEIRDVIMECYDKGVYEFPEVNNISWMCPHAYQCIIYKFAEFLLYKEFTAFLTVEGGGLYIASGLMQVFPRKKLLYALRDVLVRGGFSLRYRHVPTYAFGPRIRRYLTLPVNRGILAGEKVVIVDDFMWTGETVKALSKYARSKRATIVSVIVIGARSDAIERVTNYIGTKPYFLVEF
ncbi:MAG: phosphoribosyltransferase family protein [Desulfurococcaceae archaeon]